MTMATPGWRPLPDCPGCDRPVRRATASRNGGYCSTCRPLGASPVQALPDRGGVDLAEWQALVADRGRQERQAAAQRAARRRRRV
jgi:hypothetical protein